MKTITVVTSFRCWFWCFGFFSFFLFFYLIQEYLSFHASKVPTNSDRNLIYRKSKCRSSSPVSPEQNFKCLQITLYNSSVSCLYRKSQVHAEVLHLKSVYLHLHITEYRKESGHHRDKHFNGMQSLSCSFKHSLAAIRSCYTWKTFLYFSTPCLQQRWHRFLSLSWHLVAAFQDYLTKHFK